MRRTGGFDVSWHHSCGNVRHNITSTTTMVEMKLMNRTNLMLTLSSSINYETSDNDGSAAEKLMVHRSELNFRSFQNMGLSGRPTFFFLLQQSL